MNPKFFGVLCVAVLCVILTLGLWPFHAPKNDVSWLTHANGLEFGRFGTVQGSEILKTDGSASGGGGSVEVWVQPDRWSSSATFLVFYDQGSGRFLRFHQSLTDLELEAKGLDDPTTQVNLWVDRAFSRALREKKPTFITVTHGLNGMRVYLDGTLAKTSPQLEIPQGVFTGRIVVGDSLWQSDSFHGQIRGLAIYEAELGDAQVSRHYLSWTKKTLPEIMAAERNVALYLFDEKAGTVVHNRVPEGVGLYIPETYVVTNKIALEPFWKEFNMSQSYWKSNLMNVIGFLPVGFVFFGYFTVARPIRRALLVTVVVGFATSLTIEILQAFLPTRDSGTTDLITNTLGTYLGVLCYRDLYPVVTKRFPWLGWFQPPQVSKTTEPLPVPSSKRP